MSEKLKKWKKKKINKEKIKKIKELKIELNNEKNINKSIKIDLEKDNKDNYFNLEESLKIGELNNNNNKQPINWNDNVK